MSSIFALIPLSLVLLGIAIWGLLWAIERRQFEDLDTPPWRVVLDDDRAPPAAPGAAPSATPAPAAVVTTDPAAHTDKAPTGEAPP